MWHICHHIYICLYIYIVILRDIYTVIYTHIYMYRYITWHYMTPSHGWVFLVEIFASLHFGGSFEKALLKPSVQWCCDVQGVSGGRYLVPYDARASRTAAELIVCSDSRPWKSSNRWGSFFNTLICACEKTIFPFPLVPKSGTPLIPSIRKCFDVWGVSEGPSIGPPWCRETLVSSAWSVLVSQFF